LFGEKKRHSFAIVGGRDNSQEDLTGKRLSVLWNISSPEKSIGFCSGRAITGKGPTLGGYNRGKKALEGYSK